MSKPKQPTKLQKQLENLKRQSEEYLVGWKRCRADFENFKKEEARRMGEFKEYIREDLILQILPILDSFNLALKHTPKGLIENEWIGGIQQIKNQLEELLKVNGAQKIVVKKGDKFNPELHEAIKVVKGKEKDIVIKILQKGYTINDKLLRPTKVEVGD